LLVVLAFQDRAGCIDEPAARLEQRPQAAQKLGLERYGSFDVGGPPPQFDVRMAADDA
jgi:hypothetical protein